MRWRLRLTGQADRRLKRRYTQDAEAYQLYVNGLFQRSKQGEEGLPALHRILRPGHRARSKLPAALCRARGQLRHARQSLACLRRARHFRGPSRRPTRRSSWTMISARRTRRSRTSRFNTSAICPGAEREYQRALALAPDYAIAHMWYGLLPRRYGPDLEEGTRAHAKSTGARAAAARRQRQHRDAAVLLAPLR